MGKIKFVIFLISLISFFIALNGYAMAQLTEEQLEAIHSAKTVKIIVDQSYGEGTGVSLPFEDIARRLFGYAGVKAVGPGANNYDLKIKIKAKGKALGEYYTDRDSGKRHYIYTGASISGSISGASFINCCY